MFLNEHAGNDSGVIVFRIMFMEYEDNWLFYNIFFFIIRNVNDKDGGWFAKQPRKFVFYLVNSFFFVIVSSLS